MNKMELVDYISAHTEMTKVNASSALESVLDGIATALERYPINLQRSPQP